ncbi:MAG: YARHG domain-containing protein [Bacteroidales bacterium]|nr:YARHG domain-containing protein [Bacteroidales bacterium]
MKKIIFFLLLLPIIGNCQISKDTLFMNYNTWVYFNNKQINYKYDKSNDYFNVFQDSLLIGNADRIYGVSDYFYDNNILYLYSLRNVYVFNFNNNPYSFNMIEANFEEEEFINFIDKEYIYISGYKYLRKQNILTNKSTVLDTKIETLCPFIKLNPNLILIGASIYEAPDFLVDSITVYDENLQRTIHHNISENLKNILFERSFDHPIYSYNHHYAIFKNYIINSEYEIVSNCLPLYFYLQGVIIDNNKIQELILETKTDEKERVEIPFFLDMNFCKLMYRIYNNEKITNSDLKNYDKIDLKILKNLILAKYNYKFKDKFLQAYFNLFEFYHCNFPRKDDVSSELTDADKFNYQLIEKYEKIKK